MIRYEEVESGIVRIVLDRPERRNAQNVALLYELNDAFDRGAQDSGVRVIILAAEGPHFSAGHDLAEAATVSSTSFDHQPVASGSALDASGVPGMWAREEELYFALCQRWRNLPKPTIAQVHGKTIAGGLLLAWACDLIVASDDAVFQDPVVGGGVCGVEVFSHPWELGARKAKEVLFTADAWTAEEAYRLGMVNHVVPADELAEFTVDLARRIATKPPFALALTKEAVNQTLDIQGQAQAFRSVFALHQLAQTQAMLIDGLSDLAGLPPEIRQRWEHNLPPIKR